MEDRETPRLRKYGESNTTQIMMATVPHGAAWAGRTKYHADGCLFNSVYNSQYFERMMLVLLNILFISKGNLTTKIFKILYLI